MNSLSHRIFVGLLFAVPAALATMLFGQTPYVQASDTGQQTMECSGCHASFHESWMQGRHGQATNDPVFKEAWAAQGNPGACLTCHVTGYDSKTATWLKDGVSCEACHSPINVEHPKEPMPVDRTALMCGNCHTDSRFGWEEWKGSTHYRRDMTCTVCHDPHTTQLKLVPNSNNSLPDASALCITCHSDFAMNFPYSTHSQAGATCVSCHMEHLKDVNRDQHVMPDHSFQASLSSCIGCHASQMHAGTTEKVNPNEAVSNTFTNGNPTGISSEPAPVSPLGFAGLAALVGLAGGMVLSPWLEKTFRRVTSSSGGKDD